MVLEDKNSRKMGKSKSKNRERSADNKNETPIEAGAWGSIQAKNYKEVSCAYAKLQGDHEILQGENSNLSIENATKSEIIKSLERSVNSLKKEVERKNEKLEEQDDMFDEFKKLTLGEHDKLRKLTREWHEYGIQMKDLLKEEKNLTQSLSDKNVKLNENEETLIREKMVFQLRHESERSINKTLAHKMKTLNSCAPGLMRKHLQDSLMAATAHTEQVAKSLAAAKKEGLVDDDFFRKFLGQLEMTTCNLSAGASFIDLHREKWPGDNTDEFILKTSTPRKRFRPDGDCEDRVRIDQKGEKRNYFDLNDLIVDNDVGLAVHADESDEDPEKTEDPLPRLPTVENNGIEK